MNEGKNNGRGIFYGVIGVATLIVAIIGATFAYFTAMETGGNNITGNMASISFGLQVEKVVDPGVTTGMIPMSNTMVEEAVAKTDNDTCVDDNGNAVCQVYKITVTNNSSAAMFVDGYVALTGGSGVSVDYTYPSTSSGETPTTNKTTMRWAQVFKTSDATVTDATAKYSTAGTQVLGIGTGTSGANTAVDLSATMLALNGGKDTSKTLSNKSDTTGFNDVNILTSATAVEADESAGTIAKRAILGSATINGTSYVTVGTNYIRVSDHALTDGSLSTTFNRTNDLTSMLVLSQQLQKTGSASDADKAVYYFVVWLTETGTNQTAGATDTGGTALTDVPTSGDRFFSGVVTFTSAQGSEVTATFSSYTAVPSDTRTAS